MSNGTNLLLDHIIAEKYFKAVIHILNKDFTDYVFYGGRASAKGTTVYKTLILDGLNHGNATYVIHSYKKTGLTKGIMAQFKSCVSLINYEIEKKTGSPNQVQFDYVGTTAKCLNSGATFYFDALIDGSKGSSVDDINKEIRFVVYDELVEVQSASGREKDVFIKLNENIQTYLRFNASFIYIFNPPQNKTHPIFEFIDKHKRSETSFVIKTTLYDIPRRFVADRQYEKAEELREYDKEQWLHAIMGEPMAMDGLFFSTFDREKHVRFYDKTLDGNIVFNVIGADYGDGPGVTTYVWYSVTDKGHIIARSCYQYCGKDERKELDYLQQVAEFKKWYKNESIRLGIPANWIIMDDAAKWWKKEAKRAFANIKSSPKRRDWTVCKSIITQNKFIIEPYQFGKLNKDNGYHRIDYERFVFELEHAEHIANSGVLGKTVDLVKLNDHFLDGWRYAVMFAYKKKKPLFRDLIIANEDKILGEE